MKRDDLVSRLKEYGSDWRARAASTTIVDEAIAALASLPTDQSIRDKALEEAARAGGDVLLSGNPVLAQMVRNAIRSLIGKEAGE